MKTMLLMALRGPALVGNSDGQPPGPSRHPPARRPRNIQPTRGRASPVGSRPIALIFAIDFRLILTGLARPGAAPAALDRVRARCYPGANDGWGKVHACRTQPRLRAAAGRLHERAAR